MELDEFMECLAKDQAKKYERTPEKDTVSFSGKEEVQPKGKTNAGKDKRVINDVGNAGKNRLYRSNIFIPIAGNGVMGAAIYGPQYAPYTRYMNITGQASLHQNRMNGVSSGQGTPSPNMKLN